MAGDHQVLISVASLSQPGVERIATLLADGAPMLATIVVDVIQRQEFDVALAAAAAADIAPAVVGEGEAAVLTEARDAVPVVALATPRERTASVGLQIEPARGFFHATAWAALGL